MGLLLFAVGCMLSEAHLVRAFDPKANYWFNETLTVGKVELPSGVAIRTSDPAAQPHAYLILENQTETLLYVLSLGYKDVLVMATPDPNWKARVNIAHEVASYLVAPNRPAKLSVEALIDLDRNLVDRNVLTLTPPPTAVSIPTEQKSELLLVYNGQVIEVPFTIAYALNTNFDTGLEGANTLGTDNANAPATPPMEASPAHVVWNAVLAIGLVGAAILMIVWLVCRGKRHTGKQ
jgi:hypothetical protein